MKKISLIVFFCTLASLLHAYNLNIGAVNEGGGIVLGASNNTDVYINVVNNTTHAEVAYIELLYGSYKHVSSETGQVQAYDLGGIYLIDNLPEGNYSLQISVTPGPTLVYQDASITSSGGNYTVVYEQQTGSVSWTPTASGIEGDYDTGGIEWFDPDAVDPEIEPCVVTAYASIFTEIDADTKLMRSLGTWQSDSGWNRTGASIAYTKY